MSKSKSGPGPVPARWLECPRKSLHPIVSIFVACKTPLSKRFDVDPKHTFLPKMVFDSYKSQKIKIGLWIDLTNTNRFYDVREVESQECKYLKLQCRGHGETPSPEQTKTFIGCVKAFTANKPLEKIVVHCTHGFNRTGFLIVSYLVEVMDYDIQMALNMFAEARPPGIYKEDYIRELYRIYGDVEDAPPPPELPNWCFEEEEEDDPLDVSNDTEAAGSQSDDSRMPQKKRRKMHVNKNPEFMEGVPGVTHFTEYPKSYKLQCKVQEMCQWKDNNFPGSQPVSLDKNNVKYLGQESYRVSWKADGTRYMMLIDGEDEIYFFDRDHCVFKVKNLIFPHGREGRHIKNTLLDGEMVIDKVNGMSIPRFLVYDIVQFDGINVGKEAFYPTRMSCIENEIIKPRHIGMHKGIINRAAEPFSIRNKQFWHITQAENLLGEKFAKTLSHEPDGLIFQPSKLEYVPGKCDKVLKWKPPEVNSVDFRLKIVTEVATGKIPTKECQLFVGETDRPFAIMKYTKAMQNFNNKIIECRFNNNTWEFMRVRTDKSFPNGYKTARAVCETIKNPVSKEELLRYIQFQRFNDSEIMPPPRLK